MNPNQPTNSPDPGERKPLTLQPLHPEEFVANAASPILRQPVPKETSLDKPQEPTWKPASEPPKDSLFSSLTIKLLLALVLPIYAGLITSMTGSLSIIVTVGFLLIPVGLLIHKKIEGVLLSYALALGIVLQTQIFIEQFKDEAVRMFVPLLADISNIQLTIASVLLAMTASFVCFNAIYFGHKRLRITANIIFRFFAVWILFYFSSVTGYIEYRTQTAAAQEDYNKRIDIYNKSTLNESIPLYTFTLPAPYTLSNTHAVGDETTKNAYTYNYIATGTRLADAEVTVSNNALPQYCENTKVTRVQKIPGRPLLSCNVIAAADGQTLYGFRDFTYLKYLDIDVTKLSSGQLQNINPTTYYVQRESALIELRYTNPGDEENSPLTPAVAANFTNTIQQINDQTARQAFINQYVKPSKPLTPTPLNKQESIGIAVSMVIAGYVAAFLWAVERIFIKANRSYWKVYVPFVNLWILSKIAGKPGWWSLFALVPANPFNSDTARAMLTFPLIAPIILPFAIALSVIRFVLFVVASTGLATKFGKSKIFSLLLIIPPFPGYLILGFGKAKYDEPPKISTDI